MHIILKSNGLGLYFLTYKLKTGITGAPHLLWGIIIRQPVIAEAHASDDDGLSVGYERLSLELEAVLEGSCLVEHIVVRSCVRILEEVADTLELNCYS